MTSQLVTFLGRGLADRRQYRLARYEFPDGSTSDEVRFFGVALLRWLRGQGESIGRLRVLGTPSSMWENLSDLASTDDQEDERWLELVDRVAEGAVCVEDLAFAGEALRRVLGAPVELVVVPHGRNREEQLAIVSAIAEGVRQGDGLTLDVTHGFRHMPMLAAAAASYVARARRATVDAIYYGALEMTPPGGAAPVIELPVLGELDRWGAALSRLQTTGDTGDVAAVTAGDQALSRELGAAAFSLRSGQYARSIAASRLALRRLRNLPRPLDPLLGLASGDLEATLLSDDADDDLAALVEIARRVGVRDPMRVLSLLREAALLQGWRVGLGETGMPTNGPSVDSAWGAAGRLAVRAGADRHAITNLRNLRNSVVHGTLPGEAEENRWVQQTLATAESFQSGIEGLIADVERMM